MRARAAFLAGAGSAAILAVGWNAGVAALSHDSTSSSTPAAAGTTSGGGGSSGATDSATTTDSSPATAPTTAPVPSTPTVADGTYSGAAIQYQYGVVQVNVTIANNAISAVDFAQASATKGRQQAFPMLVDETLQAQSANISNLSGATFTTMAYQQALQSALDAAGWQG